MHFITRLPALSGVQPSPVSQRPSLSEMKVHGASHLHAWIDEYRRAMAAAAEAERRSRIFRAATIYK